MPKINSVLGPLDTKDMGFTLSHEHIVSGVPGIATDFCGIAWSRFRWLCGCQTQRSQSRRRWIRWSI